MDSKALEHTSNRTVCIIGPGQLEIQDRTPPSKPEAGEVLVNVIASGICGSDLSRYTYGNHAFEGKALPSNGDGCTVMGHESAGEIVALGPGVKHLKVGQRVMLHPVDPCYICDLCCQGRHNLCRNGSNRSMLGHADGFLVQYANVAARCVLPLPEGMSWDEAACIQPLAIAIHAIRRAEVKPHSSVAVMGAGPIGLFIIEVLKAYNVGFVLAIDISADRLSEAKKATNASIWQRDPKASSEFSQLQEEASKILREQKQLRSSLGFDVVFEATGAPSCISLGVHLCRPGAIYAQVGLGLKEITFPMRMVAVKEIDVRGVIRYATGCFEDALDLLRRKQVDLGRYISKRVPLTAAEAAIKELKGGEVVKIVIYNNATSEDLNL